MVSIRFGLLQIPVSIFLLIIEMMGMMMVGDFLVPILRFIGIILIGELENPVGHFKM